MSGNPDASSGPAGRPSPGHRPLDDVDRRLMAELIADGRVSVNELAVRANVSRATAYSRFDRLRATGAIEGFTARPDPVALGYDVAALISVDVEQGSWKTIRADLAGLPGVEWVALTSGDSDFVLLVRVPDIAALRDVLLVRLQGMEAVRSTRTIFVLEEEHRPMSAFPFPEV